MITRLLIANRGEVAIRIAQACAALGIGTVAVHPADDAASLHVRKADSARELPGRGARAYLDGAAIVAAARESGCDAIHPGYGFLSENAGFARACEEAGLIFVGPDADTLALLGDKARARSLAIELGVPVLTGTSGTTTQEEAGAFLTSLGAGGEIMLKALAGGGGRGIRVVSSLADLPDAFRACSAEAQAAFGNGELYVEQFMPRARHVEVQIAGDGTGAVIHLWERECSIQRRNQKLVEVAPAPGLDADLRASLLEASLRIARKVKYRGLGTFEFLVDVRPGQEGRFAFIEANPRLQVEHTVTEAVTGFDLVQLQLQLLSGRSLAGMGLSQESVAAPKGMAVQLRVNMERIDERGNVTPTGGVLDTFALPFGPGVRVDTFGYPGYRTSAAYDSLLAKLICHVPGDDLGRLAAFARRSLAEMRITGVETNAPLLDAILSLPEFTPAHLHTRFIEEHGAAILAKCAEARPANAETNGKSASRNRQDDPLAVLDFGRAARETAVAPAASNASGADDAPGTVRSPMQGTVVAIEAAAGERLAIGQRVIVLEAMKMQHVLTASTSGELLEVMVEEGDTVFLDDVLYHCAPDGTQVVAADSAAQIDLDRIRPDLEELFERRSLLEDAMRPDAVARRRKTGQRTARENVHDLIDPGSLVEYGGLVVAARRQRMELDELIRKSPADGLITGTATVNGDLFGAQAARCAVLSYDYTVFAGTQGMKNHSKTDRIIDVAKRQNLPIVFFTEGGGGRPGDTDVKGVGGLDVLTFNMFAKLSGKVPLVGVTSGRCFAGNAALLGCCDVVIATRNSTIGMGGPAMIEGGGLGIFAPEEVGPISVQGSNGVVDIVVEDEAEAVSVAKKYLGYFQGNLKDWEAPDQRLLRHLVPENRLEAYDVRKVIETIADRDTVLEVRAGYGHGMIAAFIRIEGRPVGVIANNPAYMGGAIDSPAADKGARFLQLCDSFGIPVLSLCDTPGMMVGPEVEKTALVRHCCRLFVTGANMSVPICTVVLRKAYGLGGQAMAGGTFRAPALAVSWPTGEFGGMGIEGEVKLGFRQELTAIEDPAERRRVFDAMVADGYQRGKAVSTASYFELDDVIDPVETRGRIVAAIYDSLALPESEAPNFVHRRTGRRNFVDTW